MNDIVIFAIELAIGWAAQWLITRGWRVATRAWDEYGYTVISNSVLREYLEANAALQIELVRRELQNDELRHALAAVLSATPNQLPAPREGRSWFDGAQEPDW